MTTMLQFRRTATPSRGSETPTSGEFFDDGLALELIRLATGKLTLLACKGPAIETVPEIYTSGRKYVPLTLDPRLAQKLMLPPGIEPHGSTRELLAELEEAVGTAQAFSEGTRTLLAAFVLGSWIPEILPSACCLVLDGNTGATLQVMRRFTPVCRHAILLGQLDRRAFGRLQIEALRPTLLALEVAEDKYTARLLRTSNHHGPLTLDSSGVQDIFCCKVIPATEVSLPECLTISLLPGHSMPILADETLRGTAEKLQPKLLSYRIETMRKFAGKQIPSSTADVLNQHPLVASIVGDDDLRKEIAALVQDRMAEPNDGRSSVPVAVIECCLAVCHEGKSKIEVNEVAKLVNATLTGRGEHLQLSDRKVGAVLNSLGLRTTDIKDVRGLELLEPVRRRIHHLAAQYKVPTIRDRQIRCQVCHTYWGSQEQSQRVL
jgi:hypothetical protein